METLHDPIKKVIADELARAIHSIDPSQTPTSPELYRMLGATPDSNVGHIAFPCFTLAKTLRKGPPQIAQQLGQAVTAIPGISEIRPVGPYLNFFISPAAFGEHVLQPILNGHYFSKSLCEHTPRTMIEFSQPNTHKELHVGHMRNLCLGDALVRLHRYAGYDIVSATFPGDVGTHVAKCLWYLKNHNRDAIPAERKGAWLGRIYTLANTALDNAKGTPDEENNRFALTAILKELESKSGEYYELWKTTREWSIEQMKHVYSWANVEFDQWYWESEVDTSSVKRIREYFDKGLLVLDQGAIGVDLSEDNLGFCLLLKSDGTGLYATKDIELAHRKFQEGHIEQSVYVVDKRQELHFKQVFKVLEKMGFAEAKQCLHLQYDFVELPDGAMSSRKGNIVPIESLIDQMVDKIKRDYLEKYRGDWSDEEIERTANQVAQGAIKYGMIRMDNNRKIVFDMNEWLKLDGESGPYIQYVCARISSMCDKLGHDSLNAIDWSPLTHPTETALLIQLAAFNAIAVSAAQQWKTAHMCAYVYDLAKLFNAFYAACSVGQAETLELRRARLGLSLAVSRVLQQGLALLGIPAPLRM